MRDLKRNRQRVFYAQYLKDEPILDGEGQDTGETKPIYAAPAAVMLNISPATGETLTQTFGNLPEYAKVIATARAFPFVEGTVCWIDRTINEPHNYKITKVAKSLNGWLYALERVEVSG